VNPPSTESIRLEQRPFQIPLNELPATEVSRNLLCRETIERDQPNMDKYHQRGEHWRLPSGSYKHSQLDTT
jgi:hypothetical protein